MYRFQVRAVTQPGERIILSGSIPEMGLWDGGRFVQLQTTGDRYPLWWVDIELSAETLAGWGDRPAEYKYARLFADGRVEWESWGRNRWVPLESGPFPGPLVIDDQDIGTLPWYPYSYFETPLAEPPLPKHRDGLKVVVAGSSVALGCSAWRLRGWAWHLAQALHQDYGHQLVNLSDLGATVNTTLARFAQKVAPEQPDIVVIALSLGNEGLAASPAHAHRTIQRRFEKGLQQLISVTRELGAYPILGGLYPHNDYTPEQYAILRETHQRMLNWGVPVLDWLDTLDDGQGHWKPQTSFDSTHPNTRGHQLMYEAIDRSLFHLSKPDVANRLSILSVDEQVMYQDRWGFRIALRPADPCLRITNPTSHSYTLSLGWSEIQTALRRAPLSSGLYIAEMTVPAAPQPFTQAFPGAPQPQPSMALLSMFIQEDGAIATPLTLPPTTDLTFYPAFHYSFPQRSQVLFSDGQLAVLKVKNSVNPPRLYIINESDHEYNLQPMWPEVRAAMKAMPTGVYEDPLNPEAAFRTLMIGKDGLESRVKAPARSAMVLDYKCQLSEISRVAILPLGDRCAVRMLLYKLEYDGPAFPFDLTRSLNLADVADMIQNDFHDMWNPEYLHYNHDARRIYHTKWAGLSFAHEVEDTDDPVRDMSPVHERMRVRYSARSRRFWYALDHCDKVLFVRTGICDRGTVVDLVEKLEKRCQGKPFRLLLISPQASNEFSNLPNVLHYNLEFNPDRMYSDLDYWMECTRTMGGILHSLGISSRNLFWCPPNLPTPS